LLAVPDMMVGSQKTQFRSPLESVSLVDSFSGKMVATDDFSVCNQFSAMLSLGDL
jgi:hypothetical protein